ncbi:hypothetical protein [Nocardia sp. CA-119907]|uniref:hypothetical protein n=1 Tax=Nocardia sp. CA-119907 TaxID=3239973 RepID=UPI003D988AB7
MPEFPERSAVGTGGAHGSGAAIAHTLVKSGAGVVVADLLDAAGPAAEFRGSTSSRHRDVTDEHDGRQVLADAEAHGTWR